MKYLLSIILILCCSSAWANLPGFVGAVTGGGSASGPSVVTDNFNRADGPLGANWTTFATTGGFSAQPPAINTNGFASSAWAAYSAAAYTGTTFANNQYAQVSLPSLIEGNVGVLVRSTPASVNGYAGHCGSSTACRIVRVTAGVETQLGETFTVANASSGILLLEVSGDTLTLSLNSSVLGTRTDSTYSSGSPAVLGFGNKATSILDNFAAGGL